MYTILEKYLQALLLVELDQEKAKKIFGPLEGTWRLSLIMEQASKYPVLAT
jgi:hypothetical protein